MGIRKYPQIKPNDRFGRLVVVRLSVKRACYPHFYWDCVCDCGTSRTVSDNKLKQGEIASCGCLRRETCAAVGKGNLSHGEARHGSETPEFRAWIARKSLTSDSSRKNYHGRGIRLCQGWASSYEAFLAALGRRPTSRHSIDRIDNDGHYSCGRCAECVKNNWPMNCRWATPAEQARNKRTNIFLTIKQETMCLTDWAIRHGLPRTILSNRLRRKWPLERLFQPPRSTNRTDVQLTAKGAK